MGAEGRTVNQDLCRVPTTELHSNTSHGGSSMQFYEEPHSVLNYLVDLMASLAETFDDLMNDVLILQLRLIASETFISSLKGRCRSVELFK